MRDGTVNEGKEKEGKNKHCFDDTSRPQGDKGSSAVVHENAE